MQNVSDRDVEHLRDAWAVLCVDLAEKLGIVAEQASQKDAA